MCKPVGAQHARAIPTTPSDRQVRPIKCKKQLGTREGMSHAETRLLVMQWLVRGGRDIPRDHPTGRTEHVIKMNPWSFERMDEAELERLAMELWP